jgi:D-alanyl-lipoteichoic acid acyltransferase DltB (MBOAT superfamily)
MLFNSFEFLWLFPIIFCVYYGLNDYGKLRKKWPEIGNALLIFFSYGLYIKWKPIFALVLLGVTAITYGFAILIDKKQAFGKKKYIVCIGLLLALLPLLIFKYYNFINNSLNQGLNALGLQTGLPGLNWAMPLGVSFFTFQAIGYLADVYLQRIKVERNWWDYMLFISFFPQIASGPISKAKDLLPQIKAHRHFDYAQSVQGLKWLLWGMFLKVVVADNLGLYVDLVFNSFAVHSGTELFFASFFYTFQIYADFAGYSFMALGIGEVMGFELINNFQRPYFSVSVTEFWRRWHISLSTWLKDYIYIPLGGNRCSKGRNYWNIFVTFLVSGIWHGANWTFIVWGMLHGIFQIVEKIFGLNKKTSYGLLKWVRIFITFILIDLAWIFFRLPSLSDAISVFACMFSHYTPYAGLAVSLLLVFVVFIKDFADEYQIEALRFFHSKHLVVRWIFYLFLLSAICISGVYGGSFIYSGF